MMVGSAEGNGKDLLIVDTYLVEGLDNALLPEL